MLLYYRETVGDIIAIAEYATVKSIADELPIGELYGIFLAFDLAISKLKREVARREAMERRERRSQRQGQGRRASRVRQKRL